MEILQTILEERTLYVFTDSPGNDILLFRDKYKSGETKIHLGYEEPRLYDYKFLGNKYSCIALWYDSEEDIAFGAKNKFDNLIKKEYE